MYNQIKGKCKYLSQKFEKKNHSLFKFKLLDDNDCNNDDD